ncbi:hypothetical protein U1Q18_015231 [Sarracenia purpurea var. burkii]
MDDLLEALDRLANAAAYFGQLLGAKNEGGDAGNDHQLRHPKAEQAVAGQTPVSSALSGPAQNLTMADTVLVGQGKAEEGRVGRREGERW